MVAGCCHAEYDCIVEEGYLSSHPTLRSECTAWRPIRCTSPMMINPLKAGPHCPDSPPSTLLHGHAPTPGLCLQALTQDKMRSAASAEMAVATESLGESELTDDDFVSLGASPRSSYADTSFEPEISMRHDLPQVPADVSSLLYRIAASGGRYP